MPPCYVHQQEEHHKQPQVPAVATAVISHHCKHIKFFFLFVYSPYSDDFPEIVLQCPHQILVKIVIWAARTMFLSTRQNSFNFQVFFDSNKLIAFTGGHFTRINPERSAM